MRGWRWVDSWFLASTTRSPIRTRRRTPARRELHESLLEMRPWSAGEPPAALEVPSCNGRGSSVDAQHRFIVGIPDGARFRIRAWGAATVTYALNANGTFRSQLAQTGNSTPEPGRPFIA